MKSRLNTRGFKDGIYIKDLYLLEMLTKLRVSKKIIYYFLSIQNYQWVIIGTLQKLIL